MECKITKQKLGCVLLQMSRPSQVTVINTIPICSDSNYSPSKHSSLIQSLPLPFSFDICNPLWASPDQTNRHFLTGIARHETRVGFRINLSSTSIFWLKLDIASPQYTHDCYGERALRYM